MAEKSSDSLFWKFDSLIFNAISIAALLVGVFFLGWAALVLLTQVAGWIKAGEWQPVPLFALFLTGAAQLDLQVYIGKVQPLDLVPSLGSAVGAEEIAHNMAGQLMGMRKIVAWVLQLPLIAALVAAGMACVTASVCASAQIE